jgi:hypothetical protein
VAFSSVSTDLVPGDTNGVPEIFVRDLGGAGFTSGPLTPLNLVNPAAVALWVTKHFALG